MFKFEVTDYLFLLLLLPVLGIAYYLLFKNKMKTLQRIGDYDLLKRLFPDWSSRREWIKTLLVLTGFAFGIIALANPQWGARKQKVTTRSTDVIIALDISQSMLAEDISPNRMEMAKRFTSQLIKSLRGERIGLVYFAGSAYMQMPLTSDYAAAELFVRSANTDQAGTQGTAIAEAIELSLNAFGKEDPTQKALIIITDGENHDSEAIELAKQALNQGTFVYTVGTGTAEGAKIPVDVRGRKEYKKDKTGNVVTTAINVDMMKAISEAGGGKFYMMEQSPKLLNQIKSEINKLEKKEVEQRSFTDFASYFQYFLTLAFLLFVFDTFTSNRKNINFNLKKLLNLE